MNATQAPTHPLGEDATIDQLASLWEYVTKEAAPGLSDADDATIAAHDVDEDVTVLTATWTWHTHIGARHMQYTILQHLSTDGESELATWYAINVPLDADDLAAAVRLAKISALGGASSQREY